MKNNPILKKIFSPIEIGGLSLRNRIVMAPMTRRFAGEDGVVTDEIVKYYRRRAANEVGLIISEGTAIDSKHAYDTLTVPRFETSEQIAAWKKVVEAVHSEGGAFAPQLWHTGRLAYFPIGPSNCLMPPRKDGTPRPPVKAMSPAEFRDVKETFAKAAKAAKDIGCDAIEIHGAHGYLLDSFVSPLNNGRTDKYGGTFEKRMCFPLEVVRSVREGVGAKHPIIYRFSQWKVDDLEERKFADPNELEQWVNSLKESGVDMLHVSTRRATDIAFPKHGQLTLAGWTRKFSNLPVIAVGSVSLSPGDSKKKYQLADPTTAFELVEEHEADLIAVGRALISNPEWVKTVRSGNWQNLSSYDETLLSTLF